jgi:hypothetical protein
MAAPVETAVLQWEDGYEQIRRATNEGGPRAKALGRLTMSVEQELRKRLGSRFSVEELAGVYREHSDALLDAAMASMPARSRPLGEAVAACDAAFYLYMREAADFEGGRSRRVS